MLGGNPVRSKQTRRNKVARSASLAGESLSSSSRARMNRSIAVRHQLAFCTTGGIGRRSGSNAQWPRSESVIGGSVSGSSAKANAAITISNTIEKARITHSRRPPASCPSANLWVNAKKRWNVLEVLVCEMLRDGSMVSIDNIQKIAFTRIRFEHKFKVWILANIERHPALRWGTLNDSLDAGMLACRSCRVCDFLALTIGMDLVFPPENQLVDVRCVQQDPEYRVLVSQKCESKATVSRLEKRLNVGGINIPLDYSRCSLLLCYCFCRVLQVSSRVV